MGQTTVLRLRKGTTSQAFRDFAKKTIRERVFISLDELLAAAKERFGDRYSKGHFLGAVVLAPDIHFKKDDDGWVFVSSEVFLIVDNIQERAKLRKAA